MAGTALPGRLTWLLTKLESKRQETPRVITLRLSSPDWLGHTPGQHVDVRLTAEDGYQAQRSYSIASAPAERWLDLTVENITEGSLHLPRGVPAARGYAGVARANWWLLQLDA